LDFRCEEVSTLPSEGNREAILAAAATLFAEHGVEETSLGQIADRAQIAKGTLYYYYPSKELLALDVFEHLSRNHLERLGGMTGSRNAGELLSSVLTITANNPEYTRTFFLLLHEAVRKPSFRDPFKATAAEQRSWWKEFFASQGREDAEELAMVFSSLVAGLAIASLVDPESVDVKRVGETVSRLFAQKA
jgi:AcrR family transcriptional regulator